MSQSLVLRDRSIQVTDSEKMVAMKVLTQGLRGIDDDNHKKWTGFLHRMFGMESGEIAEISTKIPRSGPFHRFHMLMEETIFKGQEKFIHFEQFRDWLKVGSGFCDWVAGPKGGVIPLPRSISYAKLEEPEMRMLHQDMLIFLRGSHAAPYLWKHLGRDKSHEMMETILQEFER